MKDLVRRTCAAVLAGLMGAAATLGAAASAAAPASGTAATAAATTATTTTTAIAAAPPPSMPRSPATALRAGFSYGRFGAVAMYQPEGTPRDVTLLLSGDGGWNDKVDVMARDLAALGSMVVGIDAKRYLKAIDASRQDCTYMAADFEDLSHEAQKRAALAEYHVPVLVGYSSGATLAYATLLQAPAGTFAGAMSLGFCPDLPIHRPVCRANALVAHDLPQGRGIVFDPQPKLATPWVVLNGAADRACPTPAARDFVQHTGHAELIEVPDVGHGFAAERRWGEQFRASWQRIAAAATPPPVAAAAVADLPLVELPPKSGKAPLLAVMLTGDGGWAGIDQDLAGELSRNGLGVVGFNTLKYFWKARSPEEAAAALQRVIEHYAVAWGAERVLLVGYSFGADALPFLFNRLPESTRSRIRALALLGLGPAADLEIHVTDWLPGSSTRGQPTVPEVARIRQVPILCVTGGGEADSACGALTGRNVTALEIGSGHHFGGQYERIAKELLELASH